MGGPELGGHVASRLPHANVLFMSGYADSALSRGGALDPTAAFIEKPFSGADLTHQVRRLLDSAYPLPITAGEERNERRQSP
jgi:FixJ family two-component response regulator